MIWQWNDYQWKTLILCRVKIVVFRLSDKRLRHWLNSMWEKAKDENDFCHQRRFALHFDFTFLHSVQTVVAVRRTMCACVCVCFVKGKKYFDLLILIWKSFYLLIRCSSWAYGRWRQHASTNSSFFLFTFLDFYSLHWHYSLFYSFSFFFFFLRFTNIITVLFCTRNRRDKFEQVVVGVVLSTRRHVNYRQTKENGKPE